MSRKRDDVSDGENFEQVDDSSEISFENGDIRSFAINSSASFETRRILVTVSDYSDPSDPSGCDVVDDACHEGGIDAQRDFETQSFALSLSDGETSDEDVTKKSVTENEKWKTSADIVESSVLEKGSTDFLEFLWFG